MELICQRIPIRHVSAVILAVASGPTHLSIATRVESNKAAAVAAVEVTKIKKNNKVK